MEYRDIDPHLNEITGAIVDSAFQVHEIVGPGLLESVYHRCLVIEMMNRGLKIEQEVAVPIRYKGYDVNSFYRIDILVEERVIVELKSVDRLLPVHDAQILSYLRLAQKKIGLLINFNVPLIKKGIRRFIV